MFFELVFFAVILINSVTEYKDPRSGLFVKDIRQIMKRYFQEDFLMELLPLLPLKFIVFSGSHYLYLIKVIRLNFAFKILDVQKLMQQINAVSKQKRDKICLDPKKRDDMENDHNQILKMLLIGYLLKTTKLFVIILLIVYFLGLFWFSFV